MLNGKRTKEQAGFTLLELIVAIAILVVLTGILAPNVTGQIQKAREAKYIEEAHTVFDALQFYVFDETEAGRYPEMLDVQDFGKPLDQESHLLYPYLQGKTTKNGTIYNLTYDSGLYSVIHCGYEVGGYKIEVYSNGTHKVLQRLGNGS